MSTDENAGRAAPRENGPDSVRYSGHDGEGLNAAIAAEENRLLAKLPVGDYERILPELRPVRLDVNDVLIAPNKTIKDVWFIRHGVASMLADAHKGGAIEAGTIGREGFVGLPILHAVEYTPYSTIIQVAGDGWRMGADSFRRIIDERPRLREQCLRYAQFFSEETVQSVACNRLHSLDQRCARWLLMTADRVDGDAFSLTQNFLAMMLGVRRAGVSTAMGVLQRAGIIRHDRGRITIVDRERLEAAACDCYGITRAAHERLFGS